MPRRCWAVTRTELVVLTRGAARRDGVHRGREAWRRRAARSRSVDTVGAGDSFMAAMLAMLVDWRRVGRRRRRAVDADDVPARLLRAARREAAAVTCSRAGLTHRRVRNCRPTWPGWLRPAAPVRGSAASTMVEHDRVERHAEVAGAHLDGLGVRVQAAAPVDDAVAAGVDRGEARPRVAAAPGSASQLVAGAPPGDAVLAHHPAEAGPAEPGEHLERPTRSTGWTAPGASIGLPMRDDAGDQVGAARGQAAGDQAAEAVPDDA